LGLSLAFFANLLVYYAFVSWMPTLLTSMGVAFDIALRGAFFFNLWGLPGAIAGAALVWWRGSRVGLLVFLTSAIVMSGILGFIIYSGQIEPVALFVVLSVAGGSVAGVQAGLYALSAAAYATHCRATGVGFVSGIGRIGPVVSGLGGAVVLAMAEGHTMFFIYIVVALLAAASGVLIVNRHTRAAT
jgi:AAHS family 4-hydroxybenzoate transporter-like MFS transporter